MNVKGVRSAIDMIREASKVDLIIISLLLLPLLLGSWSAFFDDFDFFKKHSDYKLAAIAILLVVYVVGLIAMKLRDPPEEKLRRARYHVENRLKNKPGRRASFNNIRESVNSKYKNDFLLELIDKNPTVFRRVSIKKHGPGIALVEELEAVEKSEHEE